jgi:hypothetical protein
MAMTTIAIVLTADDYKASIQTLRDALRSPNRKDGSYLRLDLFESAGAAAPVASFLMETVTLYIDAFLGASGNWYYFADVKKSPATPQTGIAAANMKPLVLKGAHTDIGTKSAKYKKKELISELQKLGAYVGESKYDRIKLPLSFAVVACAEAARFVKGEDAIFELLGSGFGSYTPLADWESYYKNWQALCKKDGTTGSGIMVPYMNPKG